MTLKVFTTNKTIRTALNPFWETREFKGSLLRLLDLEQHLSNYCFKHKNVQNSCFYFWQRVLRAVWEFHMVCLFAFCFQRKVLFLFLSEWMAPNSSIYYDWIYSNAILTNRLVDNIRMLNVRPIICFWNYFYYLWVPSSVIFDRKKSRKSSGILFF